jgi:hypothetical protein
VEDDGDLLAPLLPPPDAQLVRQAEPHARPDPLGRRAAGWRWGRQARLRLNLRRLENHRSPA